MTGSSMPRCSAGQHKPGESSSPQTQVGTECGRAGGVQVGGSPHQYFRTAGSLPVIAGIFGAGSRETHARPYGQHGCGVLHKPPGWFAVSQSPPCGPQASAVGTNELAITLCSPSAESDQLGCGPPLKVGPQWCRVEVVGLLWERFERAEVDLFASWELTHCPLWFYINGEGEPWGWMHWHTCGQHICCKCFHHLRCSCCVWRISDKTGPGCF